MLQGNWSFSTGNPWWLILIPLVLPPLIWWSYRSLAGLGPCAEPWRSCFRAAVIALIVLALAELQTVWKSDRLATIFLLDVSNSVPADQQKLALEYITEASKKRWKDDLAGLVVFGKEPRVEVPPAPSELNLIGYESMVDHENTDLGAAVKLALASFPEDTARRIVVLSDGNENRGNLFEQGLTAKTLGVEVDVLPIEYSYDSEVLVEKVMIPPDVKKGETVNINVVIRAAEPTSGTLQIFQKADNYRAPAAGNEQPDARAARAWHQRTHAPAAHHGTEFLYVFGRVHSGQGERRQASDQQHRRGVHPRPRQGPGALDRGIAQRASPSW